MSIVPIAILCSYTRITYGRQRVAEAKNRLPALIRAMEEGDPVIITRNGKPVAQLAPPPPERRKVVFGGMRGRIQLLPGWDDPIDLDDFLEGRL
ncbi:MAG: type II toxin-antitoxin system Phd/YefM family antitoxin [Bryobacteraceae bacterium]